MGLFDAWKKKGKKAVIKVEDKEKEDVSIKSLLKKKREREKKLLSET